MKPGLRLSLSVLAGSPAGPEKKPWESSPRAFAKLASRFARPWMPVIGLDSGSTCMAIERVSGDRFASPAAKGGRGR